MAYKNSYIFLKRYEKEKEVPKKDNTIIIKLSPSFKSLLEKTFDNIKFDCEDSEDINSERIVLKKNNKEVEVQFKYYSVKGNYYLDVIIDTKNVTSAVSIFNEINDILIDKKIERYGLYDKCAFKIFYGFYLIRLNGNSYVNTKFSISSIIPMYFKIDKFSFIHT